MVDVVDINTALKGELTNLPGIGPALAERIVEYREQVGSFADADDLLAVTGITDAVLDGIREYIDVGYPIEVPGPDPAEIHRQYVAYRLEGGEPPTPEVHRRVRRQFDRLPGSIQRPSSDVTSDRPPEPPEPPTDPDPPDVDYSSTGEGS